MPTPHTTNSHRPCLPWGTTPRVPRSIFAQRNCPRHGQMQIWSPGVATPGHISTTGGIAIEVLLFTMTAAPAMDDDFVDRLRRGDAQAFAELLDEYQGALYRFARSFGASPASAEEIVQETWLAVIEGIDGFEGRSTLKTWIFAILANQARRRSAQDRRMPPLSSLFSDEMVQSLLENQEMPCPRSAPTRTYSWSINPGDRAEQQALLEVIHSAANSLPPNQKAVLILRDFEGLSPAETCEILGVTDGNHRVLLHRARNVLRAAVTDYYEEVQGEA